MTTPSDKTEQRHFTRIPFDARVEMHRGEEPPREGRLLDICLKGALFTRPPDWPVEVGQALSIAIRLDDSPIVIAMEGHIAHADAERIGFSREHLDVDSAAHLHRLMELNLGDSTLLERELHELLNVTPR